MKKLSIILSILIILSMPMCVFAENINEESVEITAKSAILMEMESGKILYSKNCHEKLPPASITKIMTLLLTMESIDEGKISLNDVVTTSRNASQKGGSQIWLKEGEKMTVHDLLKATAIGSANDASTSLAEYIAGDEETFVAMMNKRAKELSMNNTIFENCTGLDDTAKNHYSTAYDIALMSAELMKHPKIKEYSTIWMDSLRDGKTELVNTNRLVRFYKGITGLKTGTTSKAGSCVSATAQRENMSLCAVVLGSASGKERFKDAQKLLNFGFNNYTVYTPKIDMENIADVTVLYGKNEKITPQIVEQKNILIKKGDENKITSEIDVCVDVEAPVEKGQRLGTIVFKCNNKILSEVPLISPQKVERYDLFHIFYKLWCSFAKK